MLFKAADPNKESDLKPKKSSFKKQPKQCEKTKEWS